MAADDALYVLGINAYDHDVSACLLRDGEIVAAIAKERLTRVKHDAGFFQEVVDYCLQVAGIELGRVDRIVRNCYMLPVGEMERRLLHEHRPAQLTADERKQALASPLFLSDAEHVAECSHHLAHAYSAFAASPFEEGAVMVVDGVGSYRAYVLEDVPPADETHPLAREAESYYRFLGDHLETVRKVWMGPSPGFLSDDFTAMPGLGALYSRVSTYVFGNWNRCGEVMGLAPFGALPAEPLATLLEDGELVIAPWGLERRAPYTGSRDVDWLKSPDRMEWEALARRVQEDTERVLVARACWLHEQTGARNLCIAGGVGLNCVANGRILEESPFERVFVQPAAGDDGIALGCALYGHLVIEERHRRFVLDHAYLGRPYTDEEVGGALRGTAVRLGTSSRQSDDVAQATARLLADGKIVGWFQGGSEFGPRALGNRSILADPRDARMKDRLNSRVKHRQVFRPFAPAVLAERAAEFFEGSAESPFMLLVKRVREDARAKVPSIVHVDGTARVQTVRQETNPRFHALLRAFERETGVPVLLNTSFNDRGEPIVESPDDAVICFLSTRLDALVIHDWIVEKRHLHRALFPLFRVAARARRNLRSSRLLKESARAFLDE